MKFTYFFLIIAVILTKTTFSQFEWDCYTKRNGMDILDSLGVFSYQAELIPPKLEFRIYAHIIHYNNGGGITINELNTAIEKLAEPFAQFNIKFNLHGVYEIFNSNYCVNPADYLTEIFQNNIENGINIYLLPLNISGFGIAEDIPSLAFIIGGDISQTYVIAHEMGHCLGLYHTHSGLFYNPDPYSEIPLACLDDANCYEQPSGSNCFDCGDRVCDTPPDPCLLGNVDEDCNPIITPPGYSLPPTRNIMSYTSINCMQEFTPGQYERIYTVISENQQLQNCLIQSLEVELDQKIFSGGHWQSSGEVYRWIYSDFEGYTAPETFEVHQDEPEYFKNYQGILDQQKFQNWNLNLNQIINHNLFTFSQGAQTDLTGYF